VQDPLQPLKFPRKVTALIAAAGALAIVLAHGGAISPAAAQQAYGNSYGNFFGYDTNSSKQRPAARKKRRDDGAKTTSPTDADKEAAATDKSSDEKASGEKASDEKAASTKQAEKAPEQTAANSDEKPSGKKGKKKDAKNEAKPDAPKDPVYVVISVADQHVNVYDRDGKIAHSRVSTGMPGHPTPMGVFSVIGKERYHHSNIYSGAPMPWMQRITWSGVAMHAGVVPGYPASHGCIRLPYSFAPQMWGMTKLGARVVVARRDTTPFEISHPLLPTPKMQPAPGAHQAMDARPATVELASANAKDGASIATAAVPDTGSASGANASGSASGLLNPMQYAAALKKQAALDKAAADKAAKEALAAAQAAGSEARQAVDEARKAQAAVDAAQSKLAQLDLAAGEAAKKAADAAAAAQASTQSAASATPGLTTAAQAAPAPSQSSDAAAKFASDAALAATAAAAARAAAATELDQARAALDQARRHEAEKGPASFAAVAAYKRAVAASEAAEELLTQADRRTEPVSVLISRDEGRIFIRQDWKEVWEGPIKIRDPEKPLGTHLIIAVAAQPDGSAMRWSAITVPEGAGSGGGKRSGSKKDAKAADDAPAVAPSSAAEALDRIELPEGARERMGELLWDNGAIIVSDHPRSYEMDNDTDFIVLTR
jgi:lipoprotein-anchoring transpeptidase ErfK/SrfK